MRLIGKLTPKLSLYGTISKTADVVGSNIQPFTVRKNGTYYASNGVDGFNPIYVDIPKPEWYDFTVTVTSECVNGKELLNVFAPYLTNLQATKETAIFTLMNADIVSDTSGTALQCLVTKLTNGNLVGKMVRYRNSGNLLANVADMTDGYGITPFAGAVYYAKVVQIIA